MAQIEADPTRAGGRIPTEAPVVGDAKLALERLMPLLKQRYDGKFLSKCQHDMDKWRQNMAALADAKRNPIAPQYLVSVLDELATDNAVLTCDSGTIATWAARHWTIRGGREFFLSGNLATMAPGLPYAIGIQHAFPGRQVIAFVGDGGFAMLMAEFLTAVKHKLPVKIVINNNNSLGQILWEQMVLGYPEHGVRYSEPFVDYAAFATANGVLGVKVDRSKDVRKAVRRGAPAGPAAQGNHRHHLVPGQDRAAQGLSGHGGARPGGESVARARSVPTGGRREGAHGRLQITFLVVACVTAWGTGLRASRPPGRPGLPGPGGARRQAC